MSNSGCLRTAAFLIFLIGVILFLSGCSVLPCGSPRQVQKWEQKKKFRAQRKLNNHNADSCTIQRMLAMSRKF